MGIDVLVAIGGLLLPPVVDFVKKKFLKPGADTPEATMSSLATTKPEVLPDYVTAVTAYLQAQVNYFNRDVSGLPSQWVINLRAGIRPGGVIGALVILCVMVVASIMSWKIDPSMSDTLAGIRLSCEAIVSSWFGDRLKISASK